MKFHKKRSQHFLEELTFPLNCEFCDKRFNSKNRFETHLKQHSVQRSIIKCENCTYYVTNELSLYVHEGKTHSGDFECGLCGFVAGTLEKLEIHLHTCEIYICCDICKNISEVKKHLKEKHTNWLKETNITHAKISREDSDLVETKDLKGTTFFQKS